jgi:predicted RNA-binding Zn-ribbon protein involved in translation (DUF1610 family)
MNKDRRVLEVYTSETRELIRRGGEPVRSRPCPNCGRPMHLSRGDLPHGILPDLRRYRCGECGIAVTDAAAD